MWTVKTLTSIVKSVVLVQVSAVSLYIKTLVSEDSAPAYNFPLKVIKELTPFASIKLLVLVQVSAVSLYIKTSPSLAPPVARVPA